MLKRYFSVICIAFLALSLHAQILNPVHWSGELLGDSIRLTATIDDGWQLHILEFENGEYDDEYSGTFSVTIPVSDTVEVRYNACDDVQCTAPETWVYVAAGTEENTAIDVISERMYLMSRILRG